MMQTAQTLSIANSANVQTLIFGADIGNLHARVRWGKTEHDRKLLESYVLTVDVADGLSEVFRCVSSTATHEWVEKNWLVGVDALEIDAVGGDRVMDDGLGKAKFAFPLLVALLWDVLPQAGSVVKLAISAHNPVALKDEMQRRLEGVHIVQKDKCEKQFRIELINVYAEGVGTIRSEKLAKASFLADFGSDTLIGSAFAGYTHKCNPWNAPAYGVRSLIQRIMSCDATSKVLGRVATFEEVIASLENPVIKGKKTAYFIGKVEITEAVECEVQEWIDRGLKNLERAMKASIEESTDRVATGGGCKIPQVAKELENRGYQVVTDPIWSNVNGLYEIALIKSQQA